MLVAGIFIYQNAKKQFSGNEILEMIVSMIVGGIIFARLSYILLNLSEFANFASIFSISNGGLEGFGAIIGGILGGWIYSRMKKLDFSRFLDISAPWIALAFAIGRIGCFLRGCCFGLPTSLPWGIIYNDGSLASLYYHGAVHPTQLYHALADFLIFIALLVVSRKKEKRVIKLREKAGNLFLLFLVLYSTERILIDFLRWKSPADTLVIFSFQQIAYALLMLILIVMIVRNRKKH
jgi:phosphatidylglycerol:prolipoprotein diacylglycerol transferase